MSGMTADGLSEGDLGRVADIMADAAEAAVMPSFRRLSAGDVTLKRDQSLVTGADRAAEDILTRELKALLPEAVVVGEEAVSDDPAALGLLEGDRPVWIIDPIDGTRAYVEGDPRFGMMVGLVIGGRMVAGWLHFPAIRVAVAGARGRGVAINGNPAAPQLRPGRDFPYAGRYNVRHTPQAQKSYFQDLLHERPGLIADTHSAYEYLCLLAGRPGLYINAHVTPWDTAVGVFLTREAGLCVGYIDEAPYRMGDVMAGTLLYAPDEWSWRVARDTLFPMLKTTRRAA